MTGYKHAFRKAFPYTIPVLTGYLFIGIAFGVMYAEKGYSFLWAILMSLLVYAGSGQYLAVNFFTPGISFVQVIFMTLMVNIRHIFYGISLLDKFNQMGKKRWYMIFGLTDETYSLLCTTKIPEGVEEEKFLFAISIMNQSYWVIGSAIGGTIGNPTLPIAVIRKFSALQFGRDRLCHDSAVCGDLCGTVDGCQKQDSGNNRRGGSVSLPADIRSRQFCAPFHASYYHDPFCGTKEAG